ncbi:hypothetical protein CYMTET_51429 [Cymbomonas tetramitiformis]|uniref:GRAM domain-containing protein n=1 Tax=Cymbomonas tetramitiformis TaxID=36881 RepID=A0AAE0BMY6_9CHLO|nr:hypothetical protein CYMTET_51429 [Cymbomonas tetramitiformis]
METLGFGAPGKDDKADRDKVKRMRKASAIQLFDLDEEADLIGDFLCSREGNPGRLYVFKTFVCFADALFGVKETLSVGNIIAISIPDSSFYVSAIQIDYMKKGKGQDPTTEKSLIYSLFFSHTEALAALMECAQHLAHKESPSNVGDFESVGAPLENLKPAESAPRSEDPLVVLSDLTDTSLTPARKSISEIPSSSPKDTDEWRIRGMIKVALFGGLAAALLALSKEKPWKKPAVVQQKPKSTTKARGRFL